MFQALEMLSALYSRKVQFADQRYHIHIDKRMCDHQPFNIFNIQFCDISMAITTLAHPLCNLCILVL